MSNITLQRLYNQRLSHNPLQTPAAVVSWLGAVQAQDYAGAKWALAQRTTGLTDADMDKAFNEGQMLRTHIMRPTWHFVTPEDIRWMLALTAPRVHALNAYMYRKLELDEDTLIKSSAILAQALEGGKRLTREELGKALADAGIVADGMRLGYMVHYAELEAVVCSGGRRGKQFTYALLSEQAPNAIVLEYEEALAELTKRFFISHGPATVDDFAWWSGLTKADARRGIDRVKAPHLASEKIAGHTYWSGASEPVLVEPETPTVYLLPPYDEYGIAYKNHSNSFMLDPQYHDMVEEVRGAIFNSVIVIDGEAVGFWRRTFSKGSVVIETTLFRPMNADERAAYAAATERYGKFLAMPVVLADES
jgi:hypothetical protein